uniref:Uncharacterized protein n=1 Tax=Setaria viridis TaxID=4556 RepID=A0A4U6UIN5_SETVI|nr:hypothetical protein SEVIR_5G227250v2 [Setaria viridis]
MLTVVKCAALVMAAQLAQFGISLCAPCWSLLGISEDKVGTDTNMCQSP